MTRDRDEFSASWFDTLFDAKSWWSLSSITPLQAAKLLCGFNPDDDSQDPLTTTTEEAGPDDYKRLLREFSDKENVNASPRTLSQWHDLAKSRNLKHHTWIEVYKQAIHAVWDDMTTEGKKTAWRALDKKGRQDKARELVKAHRGNKTAAGREVGISGNRIGQILKEAEKSEAPLPGSHLLCTLGA